MPTGKTKGKKPVVKLVTTDKNIKVANGETIKITPKEQIFCETWLETVNGTRSALEAYAITNKHLCSVRWSELSENDKMKRRRAESVANVIAIEKLRKPTIKAYLDKRLADAGYIEKEVWKEHYKNIRQDQSKSAKNTAIDMYYKAGGKYKVEDSGYKEEIEIFFIGVRKLMKK